MIDRLMELRAVFHKVIQRNPVCEPKTQFSDNEFTETNRPTQTRFDYDSEGISESFFGHIQKAKAFMALIRDNNEKTQELRNQYARAIKPSQQKDCSESLNAIVAQNNEIHNNLKNLLNEVKAEVEADQADEQRKDQPQTRMKRNFYLSLTSELSKTLEQERIQEDSFKKCVKEKVARQVLLIDENLTQDQVDHYVNNPQEAEQMLQKRIYGMASVNLRNAVNDIQDKFRDIQRLERSVAECLQLFKELAILVQEQGALIDNIELNVNQTKDYVEKATVHLHKARQHHRCTRKWLIWTIVIAVVVIAITLAVTLSIALR